MMKIALAPVCSRVSEGNTVLKKHASKAQEACSTVSDLSLKSSDAEHFTTVNAEDAGVPVDCHAVPGARRSQEEAIEEMLVQLDLGPETEDEDSDVDDDVSTTSSHRYPGARKSHQKAFEDFMMSASEDDDSDSDDSDNESEYTAKSKQSSRSKKSRKQPKSSFFKEISIPKTKLFASFAA